MTTTVEEAQRLSREHGVKVHWRPDGRLNVLEPGADKAEVDYSGEKYLATISEDGCL
jgi:hypothetical protein